MKDIFSPVNCLIYLCVSYLISSAYTVKTNGIYNSNFY